MASELTDPERVLKLSAEDIVDIWREEQMIDAGYPCEAALRMAMNHDIDLHRAVELLANGCNPLTAEMILT